MHLLPARITKLDIEMLHDKFWKLICFWIKRSKVKSTRHKNRSVPFLRRNSILSLAAYISHDGLSRLQ